MLPECLGGFVSAEVHIPVFSFSSLTESPRRRLPFQSDMHLGHQRTYFWKEYFFFPSRFWKITYPAIMKYWQCCFWPFHSENPALAVSRFLCWKLNWEKSHQVFRAYAWARLYVRKPELRRQTMTFDQNTLLFTLLCDATGRDCLFTSVTQYSLGSVL